MKVLFVKDAPGGIRKGEIKEVSSGHAQNFLIPRGLAVLATSQMQAKLEKENREAQAKKAKDAEKLQALKIELEKREFSLKVKVGEKGQVFGGVHEKDIAQSVSQKMNRPFDKSQVKLVSIMKEVGIHQARLDLGAGIYANLKIKIEKE